MIFNKEQIFSDDLFQYDSCLDIQKFLFSKACFLANYKIKDKFFSDFAKALCTQYQVNPKLLLVSLQREQSIILKKIVPAQAVMDRALGFGCTDAGDMKQFYGFELQLRKCVQTYRRWFNYSAQNNMNGKNFPVDGGKDNVLPRNAFTYSLYKYCPWVGNVQRGPNKPPFGNYLTWKIWGTYWPNDIA